VAITGLGIATVVHNNNDNGGSHGDDNAAANENYVDDNSDHEHGIKSNLKGSVDLFREIAAKK